MNDSGIDLIYFKNFKIENPERRLEIICQIAINKPNSIAESISDLGVEDQNHRKQILINCFYGDHNPIEVKNSKVSI